MGDGLARLLAHFGAGDGRVGALRFGVVGELASGRQVTGGIGTHFGALQLTGCSLKKGPSPAAGCSEAAKALPDSSRAAAAAAMEALNLVMVFLLLGDLVNQWAGKPGFLSKAP